MIKLVCIDLDGTLLDSKKCISESNRESIRRTIELGVNVTIFTGRSFGSAARYVRELEISIPAVFQNGALIIDPVGMKVYRSIELDSTLARHFVESCRAHSVYPVVYESFFSEKDMLVEGPYHGAFDEYFRLNTHRITLVKDLIEELRKKNSVVEVALVGSVDDVNRAIRDVSSIAHDGYTVVENQKRDGEAFVEIFGPNVGKEKALEFFLDMYGISPREVMYVGDNLNDVSIMRMVGISVAMMNAPEEVREIATYVTESNDDSGVAKALERFILQECVRE
ncbi:haloacid dehalogenase [Thermotoga sp. Ku-13t]|uniref:Cof-type HAD-IIB family hydrolase n=1 Tax=Thermotoga sp. Ku-13t TaxID=1755813 RepID=UPI0013E9D4E2|nr:Cof-type HAD-IIB family hydrolase [Thermotoga sp. Ku-13t]KAF2959050.1 haloacid dehalogenase [Thermotoga sp. Ku-13t]